MQIARSVIVVLAAATLSSGIALADPPPPRTTAAPAATTAPQAARPIYRFDVSITGIETGAQAQPATFTIILEENQVGMVHTGSNVPLVARGAPGAAAVVAPRQDVGLSLRFTFTSRGPAVVLNGSVEFSAVDPAAGAGPAVIHRVRVDGAVPVTPGTPTLFGSAYDVTTHRRYEINVTARRLL